MAFRFQKWVQTLRYARRELRSGFGGFYVFLACIMLGTATIASVLSLSDGMTESIRYDGRYILGGDMAVRTIYAEATQEQQKYFKKNLGPTTIVEETRAMARRMDDAKATMVELKAVDPYYPLYGELKFADEQGNNIDKKTQDLILPPGVDDKGNTVGDWGALIEKELLSRLDLHVGDSIMIGKKNFQIRGIITREPDRIGSAQFSIAPRVMVSRYVMKETGLEEQGSQVYFDHRFYMPYAKTPESITASQDALKKAFPDAQWRVRNYYNAVPQAEKMIERLTLFLSLIGFSTLMVGGIGISNAVRSFLDGKMSHIATLKCLGGSQTFVFRVYLTQILILATIGTIAGLMIGVGVSQVAGEILTTKFSLSDKVGVYGGALFCAAAFGILTTLAFSLWPLGRAVNVRPADLFRDAISPAHKRPSKNVMITTLIMAQMLALLAIGISPDTRLTFYFICGALFIFMLFYSYAAGLQKFLKSMPSPKAPELRMAFANLYRPGNVSASIILSLGIGLTVLVAIALVEHNFSRLIKDDIAVDAPSFFFIDVQPDQKAAFADMMAKQPSARNLQMTPSLRGRIVSVNGIPAEKALVDQNEKWVISSDRGFTYTANPPPNLKITKGEWWSKDYSGPPIVSISTDVARAFDIGVGADLTVSILGREITAKVANVREINWTSFSMNFAVTFAPGALEGAPATYLSTVIIDPKHEEKMQTDIAREFPNVTSVRVRDALVAAESMISGISTAVRASAAVTLVAGTLVLAGGIAAARRRHIYDAIVLKVLGATRRRIMKTFLLEYAMLGIFTTLIASVLGTLAGYGVIKLAMNMEWAFKLAPVLAVLCLCLTITLLAGLAGTLRAMVQKPSTHLRNQ